MDDRRDDRRESRPDDGGDDRTGTPGGPGRPAGPDQNGPGQNGPGQNGPGQGGAADGGPAGEGPEHSASADAYIGPATVVASSGLIPVEAELLIENDRTGTTALRTWSGRLEAADTGVNVFAVATSPCTLRLPDGREGTFTPGRVTVGTGVIPVTGCGLAPFDG